MFFQTSYNKPALYIVILADEYDDTPHLRILITLFIIYCMCQALESFFTR